MTEETLNSNSFYAFNAIRTAVAVIDATGKILFINTTLQKMLPADTNAPVSILDLLQDARLAEGLSEHIQSTNKEAYFFSVNIRQLTVHFQVTKSGEYYVCNGQSENDIETFYQLQVSSRKKMLEIKSKLLAICMMDKTDFNLTLEIILQTAVEVLNCERISFWLVNEDKDEIICEKLFILSEQSFNTTAVGTSITKKDEWESYFEYINKEYAFIMADDISTHPATKDFNETYSKPNNIKSLLDVPVWHNNQLYGIICAEVVGAKKRWHLEDAQFMLSLSDSVALSMQTKERFIAETQLKELNTKLQRSNSDLEHFASVAAHDMKSPLRSIVGFLSLLKKNHEHKLDDSAKEYIDYTLQNATHLSKLISELLAYSKIEQKTSAPVNIDTAELIQQIQKEQADFIKERKGEIAISGTLPQLFIQRNLLYQLFSNIMHNAIKYSHTESTPKLEINYTVDKIYHHFSFADNGIGVDDQYAEKIFSLFGRLHSLEEFDGTGIGLATCKKIIELFKGKITYQRRKNPEGSIFIISIPVEYSLSETKSNSAAKKENAV
jgi:signal transduction histidine kinase